MYLLVKCLTQESRWMQPMSCLKCIHWDTNVSLGLMSNTGIPMDASSCVFLDRYCSTVQGLLDWYEVDLGFTELLFIQIDLCVMCFCSVLPRLMDASSYVVSKMRLHCQTSSCVSYSLLHLECHLISISNLNLLGLFSTDGGKSDVEK